MRKCPTCDWPTSDLRTLLDHVEDPDTLVTLACDFADRVAGWARDPAQARAWIETARHWRDSSHAARSAAIEAERQWTDIWGGGWSIMSQEALRSVKAATTAASEAIEWGITGALDDTLEAADAAARAEAGRKPEGDWQLRHARELACTCPAPLAAAPAGLRSRNSLLAR